MTTATPAPNSTAIPTAPLGITPKAAAISVLAPGAVVVLIRDVNGTFDDCSH
jgi:hypothetical protein